MTPEELKKVRTHLGYTQYRLATLIGLSRRQYIRYENGESEIPVPVSIIVDIIISGQVSLELKKAIRDGR